MSTDPAATRPRRPHLRSLTAVVTVISAVGAAGYVHHTKFTPEARDRAFIAQELQAAQHWGAPIYTLTSASPADFPSLDPSTHRAIALVALGATHAYVVTDPEGTQARCVPGTSTTTAADAQSAPAPGPMDAGDAGAEVRVTTTITCQPLRSGAVLREAHTVTSPSTSGTAGGSASSLYRILVPGPDDADITVLLPPGLTDAAANRAAHSVLDQLTPLDVDSYTADDIYRALRNE